MRFGSVQHPYLTIIDVENREGIPITLSSYSDVFSISHDRKHHEDIQTGDVVRTGENLFPHFEVVAVNGATAWVRNVVSGAEFLAQLSRCRRIEPPPMAAAS